MSLPRVTRSVDALAAFLLGPLISAKGAIPGWSLVGWDGEQGLQLTIGRGRQLVLIEFEPLDPARACYVRTGLFNVCARRAFNGAAPLDAASRRAVDAVVGIVGARERVLPSVERSATGRPAIIREVEVPRLLVPEGRGQYYVNPYVGCSIGCPFCYVAARADLSRGLEGLPRLPWGRYVDVKVNAADVLRREVSRVQPGIVRFSPILTDPYQPLERRYRVTRACLEVLLEAGFRVVILTRAALVVEDLELLRRFSGAAVGLSVPTEDDRIRRAFEPGADPIDDRVAALERCHDAGLRTFAVVQPMLPMDHARLVERLAPHIDAVRVDRMYDLERVRPLYEAAGRLDAAEDGFFRRTEMALRAAFERRGVPYDEMDALAGLVGR